MHAHRIAPPPSSPRRRSILYQRGIYPQETFAQKKHYGLAMVVTKDDGLAAYLANVGRQMTGARDGARARAAFTCVVAVGGGG